MFRVPGRASQQVHRMRLPDMRRDGAPLSSTPKAVRRNGGSCVCPDVYAAGRLDLDSRRGTCRAGNCEAVICLRCRGELVSWGPVWCPCDNPPRWTRHPGMRQPGHYDLKKDAWIPARAAVKPSTAKRS